MTEGWPALDATLAKLPLRAPSLIVTIYGDAVLPRGGSLALADLLALMRRLGASEGMVRTAVSRLARDGVLQRQRAGRHSAYALTEAAQAEFAAAVPRIYGPSPAGWDGTLHLAFPEPGTDRSALDAAGFAVLAPGVMLGPWPGPPDVPLVQGTAPAETAQMLSARAWPLAATAALYAEFVRLFAGLQDMPPSPLDAMAARTALIHAYRRAALRDPHLPAGLLPPDWPGHAARALCQSRYAALAPLSEQWLDSASTGSTPLPRGLDPCARFSAPP